MENIKEVKSSLHISIPSKMLEMFNHYSEVLGKSRNQIIAELMEEWLEDQIDIKLAEQAIKDIKDGKDTVISWEEMKANLNWK